MTVAHSLDTVTINCFCPPACKELTYVTKEDRIELDDEVGQSMAEIFAALDSLPTLKRMIHSVMPERSLNPSYISISPILMKYMAFVNLYMSDTKMTTVTESASYTEGELIADLGGMLGLCIGLSVISILELLELLIQLCMKKYMNWQLTKVCKSNIENVEMVKSASEG